MVSSNTYNLFTFDFLKITRTQFHKVHEGQEVEILTHLQPNEKASAEFCMAKIRRQGYRESDQRGRNRIFR